MRRSRFIVVALVSMTLLGLELIWTRVFSAEFFYTFAFLTLSLAVMGLGLGALSLRLFPALNRENHLGWLMSAVGLCVLVGPPAVVHLGVDYATLFGSVAMIGRFVLSVLVLSVPYFLAGIALGLYFKQNHQDMPRLYMADLLGAGAGVIAAIFVMNTWGTPAAAFLFALPVLVAAIWVARPWLKIAPVALAAGAIWLAATGDHFLEAPREERAPVIYKHWDAMAKLKIYDYYGQARGLNIDNVANSPVFGFDGNWDEADTLGSEWDINVRYLIKQFDSCVFLSLGAGGGADALQAMDHRAKEIHAVEVNPWINHLMLDDDTCGFIEPEPEPETEVAADTSAASDSVPPAPPTPRPVIRDSTGQIISLAAFSGRIYNDPRVRVVSEDARTYVRRFHNKFDVIFSLSSNTWAALASGSFALAENYLFTTEAFVDYWNALSEGGFLSMEHQMYVPRLVTEALDALRRVGVEHPEQHIAVYDLPKLHRKLLLMSKRPLDDTLRYYAYGPLTPERYESIHLLYPAPDSLAGNLVNRVVTEGWQVAQDSAHIDLSPATDNRPFAAQLGLWRNFDWERLGKTGLYSEFSGFPLTKVVMVVILAVILVVVVPLNLLPYFFSRDRLRAAPWFYFFAVGLAFMALEVVLIQKYTLFIGASVYSIAAVLLMLLLASGIGSRFAAKVGDSVPFIGIIAWLVLDWLVFGHLTAALSGLSMAGRVAATAVLIAPLGFFMGMPFPKGTLRVGPLIDWGFAINGAASVLGGTAIVMAAFSFGFTAALALGGLLYLTAGLLLSARRAW